MKLNLMFVLLVMTIGMMSCSKDTLIDNSRQDPVITSPASNPLDTKPAPSSVWRVVLFVYNDNDITSHFNSYTIMLLGKDQASFTNGNISIPGVWKLLGDQYYFFFDVDGLDYPGSPFLSCMTLFKELNGTWTITRTYPSGMVLEMPTEKGDKLLQMEHL